MRKWPLLILLLIFLTGCYPTFKHPVVDVKHNQLDERLFGLWEISPGQQEVVDGEYGFLMFLPCDTGVCITLYTMSEKEKGESIYLYGFAAQVDGVGYINYKFYGDLEEQDYELARYTLTPDKKLRLALVDTGLLKKAIQDNKIVGTITESKDGFFRTSNTVITAERDKLIEFLNSNNIFDQDNLGEYQYKDLDLPF